MPAVLGRDKRRVQRVPIDSAGDAHAAMIRKLSEHLMSSNRRKQESG